MKELLKEYNFLTFNLEEVEQMSKDDLEMAFIFNFIKNNYSCKECKVHYATTLFLAGGITTDVYLIEIYDVIVRYIEIVNDRRVYFNTDNILLGKERVKMFLDGGGCIK